VTSIDPTLLPVHPLVAEIQAGVLVRSFVIGLVIVIPWWLHKRRRLRRDSTPTEAPPPEPEESAAPRLEDVIAEVDDAARTIAEDGVATLTVPHDVTIDGRPADPGTVDALVRDALRRSGLVVSAELDSPTGRTLECRPIGGR